MSKNKLNVNMRAFENKREITRHKVNEGDNIYRILPPFGEEADGYPYKKWSLAWLMDPQTGNKRPYASPWSFGEKDCPVGEYSKLLQEKRENLEKRLASKDLSKKEIAAELKPISEALYEVKPKGTFFYNAANKSGQVGVLELKKSAHDSLKKAMRDYIADYNQDPTSLNSEKNDSGVWFKIKREGQGLETEYTVEKSQSKTKDPETGEVSWKDDRSPLPDVVVENYEDSATNLFKLYKQISYEDLKDVLLFTLSQLHASLKMKYGAKAADLIKVEGFEFDEQESSSVSKSEASEDEDEEVQVKPTKASKPMPKFDDEDEDEDFVPSKPQKVKPSTDDQGKPTIKAKPSNKALFDMADDILA
jgi:hypothetical protein